MLNPPGPPKHSAVTQPMVGAEVELLTLQAVLAVVGLESDGLGVVAHQAGVRAQPDAASGIRHHAVHGCRSTSPPRADST